MSKKKTYGPMKVAVAVFDTQDNLVRIDDNDSTNPCQWHQNLDLDNDGVFQQRYGLQRYSNTKMWFKSTVPVRGIRLNNFGHFYTVKKISQFHFEIECKKLQQHFDGTDYAEVLITKF